MNPPRLSRLVPTCALVAAVLLSACSERRGGLVRLEPPTRSDVSSPVYPYPHRQVIDYQGAVDIEPLTEAVNDALRKMASPIGGDATARVAALSRMVQAGIKVMQQAELLRQATSRGEAGDAAAFDHAAQGYVNVLAAQANANPVAMAARLQTGGKWSAAALRTAIEDDLRLLSAEVDRIAEQSKRPLRFVITAELLPRGQTTPVMLTVPGYSMGNAPITEQGKRFDLSVSPAVKADLAALSSSLAALSAAAHGVPEQASATASATSGLLPESRIAGAAATAADLVGPVLRSELDACAADLRSAAGRLVSLAAPLETYRKAVEAQITHASTAQKFASARTWSAKAERSTQQLMRSSKAIEELTQRFSERSRDEIVRRIRSAESDVEASRALLSDWQQTPNKQGYLASLAVTFPAFDAAVLALTGAAAGATVADPAKSPLHLAADSASAALANVRRTLSADEQRQRNQALLDGLAVLDRTTLRLPKLASSATLPDLPPTRVSLLNTPADRGATLTIKAEIVGSDDPRPTAWATYEVDRLGWTGSISAHALAVNRFSDDGPFQLAPSLSAQLGYADPDVAWLRALRPVIGLDVIPLSVPASGNAQIRQTLGFGVHVGFFDGFVSVGYGHDILAERGDHRYFYYIGIDLLGSAKAKF